MDCRAALEGKVATPCSGEEVFGEIKNLVGGGWVLEQHLHPKV